MNNDALKLSQQRQVNLQQSCLIVTTFMCQHESRMALHKTDSTSQQQIYCCQHHRSPSTQFQIVTQQHNNLQHSGANLTTIMSCLQSGWHVAISQKSCACLKSGQHLDQFTTPGRMAAHPMMAVNTIKGNFGLRATFSESLITPNQRLKTGA